MTSGKYICYPPSTSSAISNNDKNYILVNTKKLTGNPDKIGKYCAYEIVDWFLHRGSVTRKKLQRLCYYSQAWCYGLTGKRLIRIDFQAWADGPTSPALYEKFEKFEENPIKLEEEYMGCIDKDDVILLEKIWEMYGDKTDNELDELLTQEFPWREARKGCSKNEKCTRMISEKSMREFYSKK